MNLDFILKLSGLVLGLVGSALLAYSLGGVLVGLVAAVNALDSTIDDWIHGRLDVVHFAGLDRMLKRELKFSKAGTIAGFSLLAASFACQLIVLLLEG